MKRYEDEVDRDIDVRNWSEYRHNEKVDIDELWNQVEDNIKVNKEYGFHLGLGMGYVYNVMVSSYLFTKSPHDAFNLLLLARHIMDKCYNPIKAKTNENYALKMDYDEFIKVIEKKGIL